MPKRTSEPLDPFDPLAIENVGVTLALELLEQPLDTVPPTSAFAGPGIYVLYYDGTLPAYAPLRELDQKVGAGWRTPVYIGRAARANARRGFVARPPAGTELLNRIRAHARSIRSTDNLTGAEFKCRYLVLNDAYISLAESVLITTFRPVWNGMGLGSNMTGGPRMKGKPSLWDSLHQGRKGRPAGTEERAREATELIKSTLKTLSEPPDERTAMMVEKIRRRSRGAL